MFFDVHEAGERALLVHCGVGSVAGRESAADTQVLVDEFVELVRSAGVAPIYIDAGKRNQPTPRYFIGAGKVENLRQIVCDNGIDVVLFNNTLSPSQERNLEAEFQCKVLDRTGLILDIFAQRARSHAGKLQVELAQLEHLSTRLIRGWTHLERQKGGIGLRGPGETQLETDRRLLRERIRWINQRLGKVNQQRQQGRKSRKRAEVPTVALVGYTNAGKSTLFNALTGAGVFAEDQLFATLDTTLRALELETFGKIVLADTVGFVRDLPHKLVEAFKATLEEAADADLLLHVVDASSEEADQHIDAVQAVLAEISADDLPALIVMNKIDRTDIAPRVDDQGHNAPERVWLSAQSGQGLSLLKQAIGARLGDVVWSGDIVLEPQFAKLRAELYALNAVENEAVLSDGASQLSLRFRQDELQRLLARHGLEDLLGIASDLEPWER